MRTLRKKAIHAQYNSGTSGFRVEEKMLNTTERTEKAVVSPCRPAARCCGPRCLLQSLFDLSLREREKSSIVLQIRFAIRFHQNPRFYPKLVLFKTKRARKSKEKTSKKKKQ